MATVASLALHSQLPLSVPITEDVTTVVVNKLSFVGTVTLFFIVTYYLIATVFLKYESKLHQSKITRALLFGCLVGGIWWVGMLESMFAFGTGFIEEFLTGFLDFVPIVFLCLLLAVFLVDESKHSKIDLSQSIETTYLNKKNLTQLQNNNALVDIAVFVGIIVLGRGIRQWGNIITLNTENTLGFILWTVAFALIIALNFVYFKEAATANSSSLVKSASRFTLVLFGLHYTMFVYFVPLIFKGMFIDLTIALLYDLLLVFIASMIAYRLHPIHH